MSWKIQTYFLSWGRIFSNIFDVFQFFKSLKIIIGIETGLIFFTRTGAGTEKLVQLEALGTALQNNVTTVQLSIVNMRGELLFEFHYKSWISNCHPSHLIFPFSRMCINARRLDLSYRNDRMIESCDSLHNKWSYNFIE
jgi:hypothetical protein